MEWPVAKDTDCKVPVLCSHMDCEILLPVDFGRSFRNGKRKKKSDFYKWIRFDNCTPATNDSFDWHKGSHGNITAEIYKVSNKANTVYRTRPLKWTAPLQDDDNIVWNVGHEYLRMYLLEEAEKDDGDIDLVNVNYPQPGMIKYAAHMITKIRFVVNGKVVKKSKRNVRLMIGDIHIIPTKVYSFTLIMEELPIYNNDGEVMVNG